MHVSHRDSVRDLPSVGVVTDTQISILLSKRPFRTPQAAFLTSKVRRYMVDWGLQMVSGCKLKRYCKVLSLTSLMNGIACKQKAHPSWHYI